MSWIRTDFNFGGHVRVLVLPSRKSIELREATIKFRDNPELIEGMLRELIVYIRPDLKGLSLEAMSFDYRRLAYTVLATHGNFSRTPPGEMTEEIQL